MPKYQIEMLWACHTCKHHGNKGFDKICQGCGSIKSELDEEYMPEDTSEKAALHGEKDRRARAGEDWVCKYCNKLQNRLDRICGSCGADQREGKKQKDRIPSTAPVFLEERAPRDRLPFFLIGGGLLILSICLWLIFRTRVVDVHVESVSWEHRVRIERYQVMMRDGWTPEQGAFDVKDQGSRIHHYNRVRTGSHEESYPEQYTCGQECSTVKGSCYTTPRSCVPNRNGSASCSGGDRVCSPDSRLCVSKTCTRTSRRTVYDYADIPENREWYSWHVWEWAYDRTVHHVGSTLRTSWPEGDELVAFLQDGEKERNIREATYHVTFKDREDVYELAPSTLEEFERFSPGFKFRLKVGVARGVEVLPP